MDNNECPHDDQKPLRRTSQTIGNKGNKGNKNNNHHRNLPILFNKFCYLKKRKKSAKTGNKSNNCITHRYCSINFVTHKAFHKTEEINIRTTTQYHSEKYRNQIVTFCYRHPSFCYPTKQKIHKNSPYKVCNRL